MKLQKERRRLLQAAAALPVLASFSPLLGRAAPDRLSALLSALEKQVEGRIGLALSDTATGQLISYRGEERFALCSTFKLLAAAAVLKRSESQPSFMAKRLHWTADEAVPYMPVTEKQGAQGMTMAELCAAAVQYSDNLAANLLLRGLGGPQAITAFCRTTGDNVTRLDRIEPHLNSAIPGDKRDTTTPISMAQIVAKLTTGAALQPAQQQQLNHWLSGNTTGDKAIRAGVPAGWKVGDKTGSGGYGTTNDVAVLWPLTGKPLVLAIYFTQFKASATSRQDVLAQVTRLVLSGRASSEITG